MERHVEDRDMDVIERPSAADGLRALPWHRRVRALVGGVTIADSDAVMLVLEPRRLPVYYFPRAAVDGAALVPSGTRHDPTAEGDATCFDLRVGDRHVADAAWSYPSPPPSAASLAGRIAFRWNAVDAWFEEDDEVFVHPKDPFHRVDVLNSSRRVRVELDGVALAESRRPRLLFETGLPIRYYLPKVDVRLDLLEPSDTVTRCPYKGTTEHFHARVGDRLHEDVAWVYPTALPESAKIENLICFYDERVDVTVDGVAQPKPVTAWSR